MPAIPFVITEDGFDLIAQVDTLGPVTITKVGLGSVGYTPTGSETELDTQIKQLTPIGSSLPTPGMIHMTAQDNSSDAYTVREIGLFAGTTLFAIYAQSDPILTKTGDSAALFSIDLALTNVPPESITIGNAEFEYPPASETAKGVAEIATQDETNTGTDDERIVTPLKLKNAVLGFVKKIGDTMTGFLVLHAKPTSALHAATKSYVDEWLLKTATYTTADYERILADTSGGAWTLTLPASPATSAVIMVADHKSSWRTNNLTIARNGNTIEGLSENLICNRNRVLITLMYDGTTWRVNH